MFLQESLHLCVCASLGLDSPSFPGSTGTPTVQLCELYELCELYVDCGTCGCGCTLNYGSVACGGRPQWQVTWSAYTAYLVCVVWYVTHTVHTRGCDVTVALKGAQGTYEALMV